MKKFDQTGLLLAEYQGKLFEASEKLNCSSPIFIRRFLHSELLESLDKNDASLVTLDVTEGIRSIMNQFGDSEYGKEKYSKGSLFWMGYMYRYIAYTRGQSTKYIMQLFKHKQMDSVYYSYHTQDPEWCVKSLLDLNDISEDFFDNNKRLKEIIKAKGNF